MFLGQVLLVVLALALPAARQHPFGQSGGSDCHAMRLFASCALIGGPQAERLPERSNKNGAVASAVLVHQTRGIGPLRLALTGATRSGSAGVGNQTRDPSSTLRPTEGESIKFRCGSVKRVDHGTYDSP